MISLVVVSDLAYIWPMTPIRLRVRELRTALGWSQDHLAALAGVRQATISKLESGDVTSVRLETLERVANALGVDAAILVEHLRPVAPVEKRRRKK